MPHYAVFSPNYTLYSQWGPSEETCDWEEVDAPTAKAAKWEAARRLRKRTRTWVFDNLGDGKHPLSGLRVLNLDLIPEEGDEP